MTERLDQISVGDIYAEFEKAIDADSKSSTTDSREGLRRLAAKVIVRANETSQPVDVMDIISKIGMGVSVEGIKSQQQATTDGRIETYSGQHNQAIEKRAALIRASVVIAIRLLAKFAL